MRLKSTYPLQSPEQFAHYVRTLRRRLQLTQQDLGERIGVTGARISQIERDPGRVALGQVIKLLHVLGARAVLEVEEGSSSAVSDRSTPRGEW